MKKIFKFISVILVFILLFSLGCNKVNPLYERVSELRLDLFSGKSESFSLSANYGFREEPYLNDGEVGNKIYLLTFHILDDNLDGAEYEISFDYKGQSYQSAFKLNPISHKKTVSFEVENFSEKEFTVTVFGNIDFQQFRTGFICQFFRFFVVVGIPVQQHDQVGILLDGTGFTQV